MACLAVMPKAAIQPPALHQTSTRQFGIQQHINDVDLDAFTRRKSAHSKKKKIACCEVRKEVIEYVACPLSHSEYY